MLSSPRINNHLAQRVVSRGGRGEVEGGGGNGNLAAHPSTSPSRPGFGFQLSGT